MTDVHSHILPGVDDGAASDEEAKALFAQYAQSGVDGVVCTPHQNRELRRGAQLREAFERLCEWAPKSMNLYLGAEIYAYEGMLDDLRSGELLTLGESNYVLVEFSVHGGMMNIPDVVYELSVGGYTPVVAHVERYGYLTRRDYEEIKDSGGLLQINARAFEHRSLAKLVKYLLKNNLLDFVASDCHDSKVRGVDFSAAKKYVQKKFPASFEKLFGDNAPFLKK